MKKVAVIQSSYLPWKGYFDIIHDSDIFVFYDDVKYTKNDWRNRNILKGSKGTFWLTIPVSKDAVKLDINEVRISDTRWQEKHISAIKSCYSRAKYYQDYVDFLKETYVKNKWESLSTLNQFIIRNICKLLKIRTKFLNSSDFKLHGEKTDRLVSLLTQLDTDYYISGPSARNYIIEEKFEAAGIKLKYKDYSGYPEYNQLWGGFEHQVSIIDLLFNCGKNAPYYIWGWRDEK